jgi:hypothetical protein
MYNLKESTYNIYNLILDLRAQGNADQVLEMMMNTLFILGLNQKQFNGRREWPVWRDLAGELHTCTEQTSRMTELRKDNNDGIVKAHLHVLARVIVKRVLECVGTADPWNI